MNTLQNRWGPTLLLFTFQNLDQSHHHLRTRVHHPRGPPRARPRASTSVRVRVRRLGDSTVGGGLPRASLDGGLNCELSNSVLDMAARTCGPSARGLPRTCGPRGCFMLKKGEHAGASNQLGAHNCCFWFAICLLIRGNR